MPSRKKHVEKASRNDQFCQFLDAQTSYYDWAVVSLFYEALHLVEAYADAQYGQDNDTHQQRMRFMKMDSVLKRIWAEYKYLKDTSESARYGTRQFSSADYEKSRKRLKTVRKEIGGKLP